MICNDIEDEFNSFLRRHSHSSGVAPFCLAYIRLLFLFKDDLRPDRVSALIEREKQLRGFMFRDIGFEEIRQESRRELHENLDGGADEDRSAALNRMFFCAMNDIQQEHSSYMTEPLFEFVEVMGVSDKDLKGILESEFSGFEASGQ